MKKTFLILLTFIAFNSIAQEKIEFIDYDNIAEEVVKFSNEEKYDKAIESLNKISKNDSTYCAVLTSKSYYHNLSVAVILCDT